MPIVEINNKIVKPLCEHHFGKLAMNDAFLHSGDLFIKIDQMFGFNLNKGESKSFEYADIVNGVACMITIVEPLT